MGRWSASAVFLDELARAVAALARASGAFDAQRVELALDVTKHQIGSRQACSPLYERQLNWPGSARIFIRREQPKRHTGLKVFQHAALACRNANR